MNFNWILPTNFSWSNLEITDEELKEWIKSLNNNLILSQMSENISWKIWVIITDESLLSTHNMENIKTYFDN